MQLSSTSKNECDLWVRVSGSDLKRVRYATNPTKLGGSMEDGAQRLMDVIGDYYWSDDTSSSTASLHKLAAGRKLAATHLNV